MIHEPIRAIMAMRADAMEQVCSSVIRAGWQPADCRIELDVTSKREVLSVRGVEVFEITERWTDTTCELRWQWLAEIPEREGYEVPQA